MPKFDPRTFDTRTIAIGVLGKPHGLHGEISLRLFNAESPTITELGSVVLERAGKRETRVVARARPFGDGFLLTFAGVTSREQAAALTRSEVRVDRAELPVPAAGEYFVSDVLGCEVFTEDGTRLGVVRETFWNGAHDVMIVVGAAERAAQGGAEDVAEGSAANPAGGAPAETEHMIPLVPDFIRAVDAAARTIRVAWNGV